MKVKVYCKSAVDLTTKMGTYAYSFVAPEEQVKKAHPFKKKIATLTSADCAAFVNALHFLAGMNCVGQITELEIVTDSGKVRDLLDVFKAEKHCDEMARYWRETLRPVFEKAKITVKKVASKDASTQDGLILRNLDLYARKEIGHLKELLH